MACLLHRYYGTILIKTNKNALVTSLMIQLQFRGMCSYIVDLASDQLMIVQHGSSYRFGIIRSTEFATL
jgi:hypothetical protein